MCFVFWLDNLCLICLLFTKGIWWGGGVMTEQIIHLFHYMFITPVTYTFSITHNDLLRMCQQNDTSAQMEIKARRCFILCNHLTWMSLINCMNVQSGLERNQPNLASSYHSVCFSYNYWWWCGWFHQSPKQSALKHLLTAKNLIWMPKWNLILVSFYIWKACLALPTEKSSLFWPAAKTKAKLVERDLFLNYWC